MDFKALTREFSDSELLWRMSRSGLKNGKPWGIIVPYIDARAIMNRLDEVCGPHGWQDSYVMADSGCLCTISIWIEEQWISKSDGSGETKVEAFKGGISKALVRCAVKWGMGRYLYNTPTTFAEFVDNKSGAQQAKIKNKDTGKETYYNWVAPKLNMTKLPKKPKSDSTTAPCELCFTTLILSGKINEKHNEYMYYCPEWKDKSKGEHTIFPQSHLDSFMARINEKYQSEVGSALDHIPNEAEGIKG